MAFREIAGVIGFAQKIPIIPAVPRLMCDLDKLPNGKFHKPLCRFYRKLGLKRIQHNGTKALGMILILLVSHD